MEEIFKLITEWGHPIPPITAFQLHFLEEKAIVPITINIIRIDLFHSNTAKTLKIYFYFRANKESKKSIFSVQDEINFLNEVNLEFGKNIEVEMMESFKCSIEEIKKRITAFYKDNTNQFIIH